ncbi:hypothetical protein J437_LFUL003780 [Ladona fulva]|uniref:Uncharacterized protein n=1 Tax=Ladona fulva TaxID=123851 RepID=A0A8K0JYK1_LADFU|nr:hypothetical protein J437_LFUL003780 [Ladona fulva]
MTNHPTGWTKTPLQKETLLLPPPKEARVAKALLPKAPPRKVRHPLQKKKRHHHAPATQTGPSTSKCGIAPGTSTTITSTSSVTTTTMTSSITLTSANAEQQTTYRGLRLGRRGPSAPTRAFMRGPKMTSCCTRSACPITLTSTTRGSSSTEPTAPPTFKMVAEETQWSRRREFEHRDSDREE